MSKENWESEKESGIDRRRFLAAVTVGTSAVGVGVAAAAQPAPERPGVRGDPRPRLRLPNDARIIFTVTVAFEAFAEGGNYGLRGGKQTEASRSYAQYAYDVGIWRILEMLDRHSIKASFSTSGLAAKQHPNCIRAMIENGHESYGHGWAQGLDIEPPAEVERQRIRDTLAAIEHGGGVRPVGWAGPGSQSSPNTLRLLVEEGVIWNGDDASNDIPFMREIDGKKLVMLPRVNFPTNDLILIHKPQNPVNAYFDNFKNTFDALYEEGRAGRPQWVDLLLHCDVGARPPLSIPFQNAIKYAKGFQGVWQPRRSDIAEWMLKSQI